MLAVNFKPRLKAAAVGGTWGLLVVLWLAMQPAWPQDSPNEVAAVPRAPIVLDGRELFSVGELARFTAAERAAFANQVLADQIRRAPTAPPIRVRATRRDNLMTLRVAGRHLLTVTDEDLVGGISAEEQAEEWVQALQEALNRAQQERTRAYYQQVGRYLLIAGGILAGGYGLLQWLGRRLRQRRNLTPNWQLILAEIGLLSVQWGAVLGFVFWLAGRFPQARRVRYQVLTFLADTFTAPIVSVGGQGYSVLELGKILALILILWLAVRAVTRLIRARVLQAVGAGREVQDAIALLLQVVLVVVGVLVVMQAVGVDISSLTIFVSVIGVGVGFGLQNIANNFISGVIILLERPIQVGDFVELGELTGTVERVGLRSTEISTLDRVAIIVPNSEFIDSKVINWSHGHPVSRLHIPLGVAYGSPINQVRQAVLEVAKCHPKVLRYPKPQLWFQGFGDSSLDFDLLVWICEPRQQLRIRSDLYYLLEANLRRYRIEIPFPQRDIHIRTPDKASLINPVLPTTADVKAEVLPPPTLASTEGPPCLSDIMAWSDIIELTDEPTELEIKELAAQMRGPEGVEIRDRRFGLHLYHSCFIGSDAVNWFIQHQMASREEAVRLGQSLLKQGLIRHVTDEHPFKDAYLFYRFVWDESAEEMPS